jgi:DNA-binding SARP family transcriptional activator
LIRLRVLGSVDLRDDRGIELRRVIAQPKRFALLTYLAVRGGFHRRDALLGLFWPELDVRHARDSLSHALRFLRKELGGSPESIVVNRGAEELAVDGRALSCDAVAFRAAADAAQWREALELYEGDFLDGFFLADARGFENWAEDCRAEFRRTAARVARHAAASSERDERYTTAVNNARRAAELSSVDERIVRELLELLDRLGDRAGALHAYEQFARQLAAEYDAEPSSETKNLVSRIRARSQPTGLRETSDREAAHQRGRHAAVDLIGSRLDGWQVEGILRQGGMATVYLARDAKHGRRVALKAMRTQSTVPNGAQRFLREIQIMAQLSHPHILPLIDSGAAEGMLYLVTPYVDGESLRELLSRDHQLPVDRALRITHEVASALDYAHRQGVVHRDIKPANILLQEEEALVADFGIARAASVSGGLLPLSGGWVPGTPAYMSPEQASGDLVDARSDIYSLAAVLYEMLTGTPPHSGGDAQTVLQRIVTDPVQPVRHTRSEVPTSVESALMKALVPHPAQRFGSVAEFARALREDAPVALPDQWRPLGSLERLRLQREPDD